MHARLGRVADDPTPTLPRIPMRRRLDAPAAVMSHAETVGGSRNTTPTMNTTRPAARKTINAKTAMAM
jgi:hypothetical protein